jgi:hypothetical protein
MKYTCKTCKYSTDRGDNWARHNNSKSHLKKVLEVTNKKKSYPKVTQKLSEYLEKNIEEPLGTEESKLQDKNDFICPNCKKHFKYKSGLSRHINYRCQINSSNQIIEELKKQNEELKEELKEDREYIKSLVEKNSNITSSAINFSSNAINFSSNAFKYITQNFTNAPLLKPMNNYLAIKNDCGERHLTAFLCDHYNDKTLVKYLGCKLLEYYKKSNPADQSLWTSDCSRLNYIIRSVTENKPEWVIDKKGIQIKTLVVTPLLEHIQSELTQFLGDPTNKDYGARFSTCVCIICDIRNNVISDDLIRYLSPYFHFSQKN